MCDKRIISLKKMALKPPPRPVQTVTAIPLTTVKRINNSHSVSQKPSPVCKDKNRHFWGYYNIIAINKNFAVSVNS